VVGRLLGQWLTERLGQQVIIENRPGAASNIAAEAAIRSPPDGYTLFMIGPNNAINASVYDKLRFDIVRDSAPVAGILRVPNVMEVNPAVPVTSVPEFIATPRPIRARSTLRRAVSEPRCMCPASCSR